MCVCTPTINNLMPTTEEWRERWVDSEHKSDYGTFEWTAGKFYGDAEKDKGTYITTHLVG